MRQTGKPCPLESIRPVLAYKCFSPSLESSDIPIKQSKFLANHLHKRAVHDPCHGIDASGTRMRWYYAGIAHYNAVSTIQKSAQQPLQSFVDFVLTRRGYIVDSVSPILTSRVTFVASRWW